MRRSTPGTVVSTGVSTGFSGTAACDASRLSQNASKSVGRGVDSPIRGRDGGADSVEAGVAPVLPP
jgi:hypothetical protein